MHSSELGPREDYTVGWVCALPVEIAAARALLDDVHGEPPANLSENDPNSYVLGNIQGHNIVLAHPPFDSCGTTSTAAADAQMRARFKSIRFSLMVGIGGGAPSEKNDIRLGDFVVSKPTSTRPGLMQLDLKTKSAGNPNTGKAALSKPSTLLLAAAGKAETIAILWESMIFCYMAEIVNKDAFTFACPTANKNVLCDSSCESTNTEFTNGECTLHIAITGGHKDVVSVLLDRSASIESKASYGDTPLIRAIQANSEEIIELLLEHGARVDGLPGSPGFPILKGPMYSMEERVKQLLGLQEQLFVARYKNSSRLVGFGIRTLTLSFYLPPLLKVTRFYLRYSWIGRWEVMHVLQDLVKNGKTDRLRRWAEAWIKFGTHIVETENTKNLTVMTALSVQIFEVVSTADLKALLVIGVLVGSAVILAAAQREWREGVDISARTFTQFASLDYHRDAGESLHYGVREFLVDFDRCIWSAKRDETVARTIVLFTTHFTILESQDELPIQYFSTVIAEYFEKFISGGHKEQLFNNANRACANELKAISKDCDSHRLLLFLTAIVQFAQRLRNKGKD
ncbi:hypothetical protein MY1884_009537 [Beauveria asiatica]